MLKFTLSISCLTSSNLPWFMDLTFQVPMQCCSLQHQDLLPSPVKSTAGCYFCFDSVSSFFLELFLHWSPVAYWVPANLGSYLSMSYLFCLFTQFMGFSRQEYWSGLPFPSLVDHVLSELSTVTHPSWVALHGMAHSFTKLEYEIRKKKRSKRGIEGGKVKEGDRETKEIEEKYCTWRAHILGSRPWWLTRYTPIYIYSLSVQLPSPAKSSLSYIPCNNSEKHIFPFYRCQN